MSRPFKKNWVSLLNLYTFLRIQDGIQNPKWRPSPMLLDVYQLMTKPDKSQLIRELEDKLKLDDYSYNHKQESAFVIDVVAAVCRLPLSGHTDFSNLLSQFTKISDVYNRYGRCSRCDNIFDIYNANPSVKDSERLQQCDSRNPGHS